MKVDSISITSFYIFVSIEIQVGGAPSADDAKFHSCATYNYVSRREDSGAVPSAKFELIVDGAPTMAYCDMYFRGGGWLMILKNSFTENVWTSSNVDSLNSDSPVRSVDSSKLRVASSILKHRFAGNFVDLLLVWTENGDLRIGNFLSKSSGLWLRRKLSDGADFVFLDDGGDVSVMDSWGTLADSVKSRARVPWITGESNSVLLTMKSKQALKKSNEGSIYDLVVKNNVNGMLKGKKLLYFVRESLKGLYVELIEPTNASSKSIRVLFSNVLVFSVPSKFCGLFIIAFDLMTDEVRGSVTLECGDYENVIPLLEFLETDVVGMHRRALLVYSNKKIPSEDVTRELASINPDFNETSAKIAFVTHASKKLRRAAWWESTVTGGSDDAINLSTYVECVPIEGEVGKSLYEWSPWSNWTACDSGETKRKRKCCSIISGANVCQGEAVEFRNCKSVPRTCASEKLDGRVWPTTRIGSTARLPCSDDRFGITTRYCSETGLWRSVDADRCVRREIKRLSKKAKEFRAGKDEMISLLEDFVADVDDLQTIAEAKEVVDIYGVLARSSNVVFSDGSSREKETYVKEMVEATDTVTKPANKNLYGDDKKMIAKVIVSSEKFAVSVMLDSRTNGTMTNKTYAGRRYGIHLRHFEERPTSSMDIEHLQNKIHFDKDTLNSIWSRSTTTVSVAVTVLNFADDRTFYGDANRTGSDIVSVNFYPDVADSRNFGGTTDTVVRLTFGHIPANYEPTCVYLDTTSDERLWSTKGCRLLGRLERERVVCACNHTTNYAVLMQVVDVELTTTDNSVLMYVSYVGIVLSVTSIVLMMCVYFYLRNLQSVRIQLHKSLSLTLLCAQMVFLFSSRAKVNEIACTAVTLLQHFLFTSVFCWMLSESLHLFIIVTYPTARVDFLPLVIIGVAFPAIVVAITASLNFGNYVSRYRCWLNTSDGIIYAFVGPTLSIILVNVIILAIVVYVFLRVKRNADRCLRDKIKAGIRASFILLPIFGVTWLFGIFTLNRDTVVFSYIFCLLNSVQGVGIFLFHVILNEEVQTALRNKLNSTNLTFNGLSSKRHDSTGVGLWIDLMSKLTRIDSIKKRNKVYPVVT